MLSHSVVYYLPIWFQAIDGKSAVSSGINLLPMVIPIAVTSIITGQLISRIGYYTPFMIFGVCLTAIGTGLLTTLEVGSSQGALIGFQIVYGIGLGEFGFSSLPLYRIVPSYLARLCPRLLTEI